MKVLTQFWLEQTIWIPIIVCLLRYRQLQPTYLPLLAYLLVRETAEVATIIIIKGLHIRNNSPVYNILYLLEAVLITWLLYNMGAFKKRKRLYVFLQLLWVFLWTADVFSFGSFYKFNTLFRSIYTLTLVVIIVGFISQLAIKVRGRLSHNTEFCLCIGFAFWFLYNFLYEFTDFLSNTNHNLSEIGKRLTTLIGFVEIFLFLLIAWAVYHLPIKKVRYLI